MKPVTAPPRNATCNALFSPPRAASAVRTFARTAMFMPTYPAAADRTAPTMYSPAVVQLTKNPITIAMATPMIAITVYWRFR